MAGGSSVGDVRLILWRLEAPSTAVEFDVGGWRPGGMIGRRRRGGKCLFILSASGRVKEDPGGSGVISRGRSINSVEVGGAIHGGRIRRRRLEA